MFLPRRFSPLLLGVALLFSGCSNVYYDAMEKVGIPKRKILVDRVGAAREAQQDAKTQFSSALAQFLAARSSMTTVSPGCEIAVSNTWVSPTPRSQAATEYIGGGAGRTNSAPVPRIQSTAGSPSGPDSTSLATPCGMSSRLVRSISRCGQPIFARQMIGEALQTHSSATSDLILQFGPYKGTTLAQVAMSHPEYVRQLMTRAQRPEVRAAAGRLVEALDAAAEHKRKTGRGASRRGRSPI